MATNPMQKKSRNAFILGVLVMFVITVLIVALLYMKIQNQDKELKEYKGLTKNVYVLNQDVKSGQVLTAGMFSLKPVASTVIPAGATTDVITTLSSYSLSTKDGRAIYYNPGTTGSSEDPAYYYVGTSNDKHPIYVNDDNGNVIMATTLKASDKAFFYAASNNQQRTDIEVSENAVVAKVDLNANTVLTGKLLNRADEITTDDLRKEEYNVISLPVDLAPGEYVDIRLMLPNGQNYIVLSKKKVSIPVVNSQYLSDTIQMNLTEEEILILSGAIVENFKIDGSKLYASRYTEAGMQNAATMTYYPNTDIQKLLENDPNVVRDAINGILSKRDAVRSGLDSAVSNNGREENVSPKTEQSITSTQEQRKNYLLTLPVVQ